MTDSPGDSVAIQRDLKGESHECEWISEGEGAKRTKPSSFQ